MNSSFKRFSKVQYGLNDLDDNIKSVIKPDSFMKKWYEKEDIFNYGDEDAVSSEVKTETQSLDAETLQTKIIKGEQFMQLSTELIRSMDMRELCIINLILESYKYNHRNKLLKPDDYFMLKIDYIRSRICISEFEEKRIIKKLCDAGILKTSTKYTGSIRHAKLYIDKLTEYIERCVETQKIKVETEAKKKAEKSAKRKTITKNI